MAKPQRLEDIIADRIYGISEEARDDLIKAINDWHNSKQLTENQYGMNYILLELVCRSCAGRIECYEDHRFCHEYKIGKARLKKAIKEAMDKK